MNEVYTYHAVDEEATSPAEVMLYFTEVFAFPLLMSKLSEDSTEARFRIYQHELGEAYLKRARRIIAVLHLPLEASLNKMEVGGLIREMTLILKYIQP